MGAEEAPRGSHGFGLIPDAGARLETVCRLDSPGHCVSRIGSMSDLQPAGAEKKIVAGVFGIVLGSLGIHKFILGYTKEGIIMLVITLLVGTVTFGMGAGIVGLIGLIEGIIYLTRTDQEFVNTYVIGRRGWF